MAVSLQSGIREYNGDLSQYTGMLGGLTPDIHTLRSLNPMTTNRVMVVMYRGPYFLMKYFNETNPYDPSGPFGTYKKLIEYYNTQITVQMGDGTLNPAPLQGGFAGRQVNFPTVQNAGQSQTLTIKVPELVGRPAANFHNMWVDGIADPITGLTTYHGLVAGSYDKSSNTLRRIFTNTANGTELALEPSPAWEVAEFLVIALDRSGARVEGAVMALGCVPTAKVGNNDLFSMTGNGQSQIQQLDLSYNCQFVQSSYVNDLAARYVRQFAVFGNSLNFNPGAGDAFFQTGNTDGLIDSDMFNGGKRPSRDSVQSALGNAPVFRANPAPLVRDAFGEHELEAADHSRYYYNTSNTTIGTREVDSPYSDSGRVVDNNNG